MDASRHHICRRSFVFGSSEVIGVALDMVTNLARERPITSNAPSKVFIVGGGFAGIAAAKALAGAPVDVTLIDRRNHHVFQPLLYQVATASLAPADISAPICTILRGQRNCQVAMAEITAVDVADRRLSLAGGHVRYD